MDIVVIAHSYFTAPEERSVNRGRERSCLRAPAERNYYYLERLLSLKHKAENILATPSI